MTNWVGLEVQAINFLATPLFSLNNAEVIAEVTALPLASRWPPAVVTRLVVSIDGRVILNEPLDWTK
jgi:hypothetical protein